jgi:glycosyltransferase involved in cell wall biosynthesis
MIICFDCFKLVKGQGKSIGIYNMALNLVQNLTNKIFNVKSKDEIIVLGNEFNKGDFDLEGVTFIQIPWNPLSKVSCIAWELLGVSYYSRKYKVDRIVFPRGFLPLFVPVAKSLIIVHDLIPFYYHEKYPGVLNKYENAYIMNRLKTSIKKADEVITISETSKQDILRRIRVDNKKITVIHNGYNAIEFRPVKKTEEYIIAITSMLPHKNAVGVIKSYEEYCKIDRKPLALKIIGIENTDAIYPELHQSIKQNITCIKYVQNPIQFYTLVASAKIFLFLSLIEGFGFPPIEAMQLQVPVICSNESSLPEVVKEAAKLVNPNDYRDVAENIKQVINDSDLQTYLINQGKINIERFNWVDKASDYLNVIKR